MIGVDRHFTVLNLAIGNYNARKTSGKAADAVLAVNIIKRAMVNGAVCYLRSSVARRNELTHGEQIVQKQCHQIAKPKSRYQIEQIGERVNKLSKQF